MRPTARACALQLQVQERQLQRGITLLFGCAARPAVTNTDQDQPTGTATGLILLACHGAPRDAQNQRCGVCIRKCVSCPMHRACVTNHLQDTSTASETGQSASGQMSPPYRAGVVGMVQLRWPMHRPCTTWLVVFEWQEPCVKPRVQSPPGLP